MEEKDLLLFKERLEAMKDEINSDVEQTLNEMTSQTGNIPDPNDRASVESDRSFELRIRGRERKLMDKIEEACIGLGRCTCQNVVACHQLTSLSATAMLCPVTGARRPKSVAPMRLPSHRAGQQRRALEVALVITSYSIHYTKLYERRARTGPASLRRRRREGARSLQSDKSSAGVARR